MTRAASALCRHRSSITISSSSKFIAQLEILTAQKSSIEILPNSATSGFSLNLGEESG
jgi:hypothetical protein